MTTQIYWLTLMMNVSGTAEFLVYFAMFGLMFNSALHLFATILEIEHDNKIPSTKPFWIVFFVAMAVATIVPGRADLLTATAITKGPAAVEALIKALNK